MRKKNINKEIFKNHFKYQNPSSLVKDLFKVDKKTDKVKYMIINELMKFMEDININEISANKNPKRVVNIVEKSRISMNNKKIEELKH